jgi:hypothetical protein
MSEKIFYTPSSPEDEPIITMNLPEGTEVTLERTNTALYTYMGNLAVFNHAYYVGTEKKTPFYMLLSRAGLLQKTSCLN